MSFSKEKREQIKRYILEKINDKSNSVAKKTADAFGISLNTVYRYLRELEKDGIIKEEENEYVLTVEVNSIVLSRKAGELDAEDEIYRKYIKKYIEDMPDNVRKIWEYSFMEMMNNAIDHSEAEIVLVCIRKSFLDTYIIIYDMGVGIFEKIREYYGFSSLDDAVHELFKGKLTTDSKRHSGEGIFFTSRILDEFAAISSGKIFTHDKYVEVLQSLDNVSDFKEWKNTKGTIVSMKLSNFSNKKLAEVFEMFANIDGGFAKTHIPIKNIYEDYPVSRSQAKRLCNRFEKFEEVELDFKEVEEIGQGFAHEIFVVFQNANPKVRLIPINMNLQVERMVNHVILSNE